MNYSLINLFIKYVNLNWIKIILIILSIFDLRVDLRILFDSFTISSLIYTIKANPLPIFILLFIPFLITRNK